jgi:transcription initiation factor IIF auxiliary subunit
MKVLTKAAILTTAVTACALAQAQRGLQVRNTYRYHGQGHYEWTVFLTEGRSTLDKIGCVEYTLHPTYPNPVRRVCDSTGGFRLSTDGWGEFTLFVKIEWKNQRATRQQYRLDLHTPPPAAAAPAGVAAPPGVGPIRTGNTARRLEGGQWEWTVFVAGDDSTVGQIQCVQYTLHPTFPDPIQRVCGRGSRADAAFPFTARGWGTFEVGVKVEFRDGSARELRHRLHFESGK